MQQAHLASAPADYRAASGRVRAEPVGKGVVVVLAKGARLADVFTTAHRVVGVVGVHVLRLEQSDAHAVETLRDVERHSCKRGKLSGRC